MNPLKGKCRPFRLPSPLPIREVIAVTFLQLLEREENLPEQVGEAGHPPRMQQSGDGVGMATAQPWRAPRPPLAPQYWPMRRSSTLPRCDGAGGHTLYPAVRDNREWEKQGWMLKYCRAQQGQWVSCGWERWGLISVMVPPATCSNSAKHPAPDLEVACAMQVLPAPTLRAQLWPSARLLEPTLTAVCSACPELVGVSWQRGTYLQWELSWQNAHADLQVSLPSERYLAQGAPTQESNYIHTSLLLSLSHCTIHCPREQLWDLAGQAEWSKLRWCSACWLQISGLLHIYRSMCDKILA